MANDTLCIPWLYMFFTALLPPPPTPMTFMILGAPVGIANPKTLFVVLLFSILMYHILLFFVIFFILFFAGNVVYQLFEK